MDRDDQLRDIESAAIRINIQAMVSLRKTHGDRAALVMARALLGASAFMLKLICGSKVAAMELYSHADRYACE